MAFNDWFTTPGLHLANSFSRLFEFSFEWKGSNTLIKRKPTNDQPFQKNGARNGSFFIALFLFETLPQVCQQVCLAGLVAPISFDICHHG